MSEPEKPPLKPDQTDTAGPSNNREDYFAPFPGGPGAGFTIRCPHCQETGCDGSCRFRVGRRGFIGLGLGALAASVLPCARLDWIRQRPPFYSLVVAENIATFAAFSRALDTTYNTVDYYKSFEQTKTPMLAHA